MILRSLSASVIDTEVIISECYWSWDHCQWALLMWKLFLAIVSDVEVIGCDCYWCWSHCSECYWWGHYQRALLMWSSLLTSIIDANIIADKYYCNELQFRSPKCENIDLKNDWEHSLQDSLRPVSSTTCRYEH